VNRYFRPVDARFEPAGCWHTPPQYTRRQRFKWHLRDALIGIAVVVAAIAVGTGLALLLFWAVVGWK
jgi:hypothetical protein